MASIEGEPSAADVQEVVDKIEDKGIEYFFIEEYTSEDAVASIVDETNSVTVLTLYHGNGAQDSEDGVPHAHAEEPGQPQVRARVLTPQAGRPLRTLPRPEVDRMSEPIISVETSRSNAEGLSSSKASTWTSMKATLLACLVQTKRKSTLS